MTTRVLPRTIYWQVRDWRWLWLRKRTESFTYDDATYAALVKVADAMAAAYPADLRHAVAAINRGLSLRSIHPPR